MSNDCFIQDADVFAILRLQNKPKTNIPGCNTIRAQPDNERAHTSF